MCSQKEISKLTTFVTVGHGPLHVKALLSEMCDLNTLMSFMSYVHFSLTRELSLWSAVKSGKEAHEGREF